MAQELTPEELLVRVAQRDDRALAELYDRLAPSVLGMLVRMLADRAQAEEVLQEAFLRLWIDARRFGKEQVSVTAGLVFIARAKAMSRIHSARGLKVSAAGKSELQKIYSWLPRPKEVGILDGRQDLFKKVINQLPQPQRDAFELAIFGGYTETEIASKLGQPLGKVRSSLLAAAGFIRHRLAAVMRTWAANI